MWSPPPAAPAQVPAAQLPKPRLVPGTGFPCPGWGMRLPLSQLQLQPVTKQSTFPTVKGTNRDTETQTRRTLTWLITGIAQTRQCLRQRLQTGLTPSTDTASQVPSLLSGWWRWTVTHSRFTSTHIFAVPLSISTHPPFARQPCLYPRPP